MFSYNNQFLSLFFCSLNPSRCYGNQWRLFSTNLAGFCTKNIFSFLRNFFNPLEGYGNQRRLFPAICGFCFSILSFRLQFSEYVVSKGSHNKQWPHLIEWRLLQLKVFNSRRLLIILLLLS